MFGMSCTLALELSAAFAIFESRCCCLVLCFRSVLMRKVGPLHWVPGYSRACSDNVLLTRLHGAEWYCRKAFLKQCTARGVLLQYAEAG